MNNLSSHHTGNLHPEKVLHVITQFYPPDYAPTGQLIKELITYLGVQGHSIQVYTGQPGYVFNQDTAPLIERSDQILVQRMPVIRFWSKRIRGKLINGLFFVWHAGQYLLKNVKKGDILLITTAPPFLSILGYLLKLLLDVSYCCIIYDLYPDVAVQLGVVSPNSRIVKLWDILNRQIWNNAEQIIVLSSSMKERVLWKHPKLSHKISIIHNWTDHNWIVPIEKAANWFAHEYHLDRKFTVLYSGNFGRCHDMDTILEAVYQLRSEPIQFVFIGDGAGYQSCVEQVKAWGLQNCLFLPYQDRKVLPYSLTACDLSLVSIKSGMEGVVAPSKLYSILASGRPVAAICERHSYLSQIIAIANCGETFENGNWLSLSQFIRFLSLDPKLAKTMGQAGRSYLTSNFTLEIIGQQYATVLGMQQMPRKQTTEQVKFRTAPKQWPNGHLTKPIGQILQEAGLISKVQVDEILQEQATHYAHLRFGELIVYKGWLKQETIDFVLNANPLSQIVQEASSLLSLQMDEILEHQMAQYRHLRFGELAVLKGWINQETMNFLLENPKQQIHKA